MIEVTTIQYDDGIQYHRKVFKNLQTLLILSFPSTLSYSFSPISIVKKELMSLKNETWDPVGSSEGTLKYNPIPILHSATINCIFVIFTVATEVAGPENDVRDPAGSSKGTLLLNHFFHSPVQQLLHIFRILTVVTEVPGPENDIWDTGSSEGTFN